MLCLAFRSTGVVQYNTSVLLHTTQQFCHDARNWAIHPDITMIVHHNDSKNNHSRLSLTFWPKIKSLSSLQDCSEVWSVYTVHEGPVLVYFQLFKLLIYAGSEQLLCPLTLEQVLQIERNNCKQANLYLRNIQSEPNAFEIRTPHLLYSGREPF